MNPKVLLGQYVRDLLNQPERTVVILGRSNVRRGNTTGLQIVIDSIAPVSIAADSQEFDGTDENLSISQFAKAQMTIDFMGDSAMTELEKFLLLNRSQAGYDLKETLGMTLSVISSIQDLRFLSGKQYSERYQITVNLAYTLSMNVPTLRVDTPIIEPILSNN